MRNFKPLKHLVTGIFCNFANLILTSLAKLSLQCIHLRQLSLMRKRRKYNRVHKRIRLLRACRPRIKSRRPRYSDTKEYFNSLPEIPFVAPQKFNLRTNPEEVIQYVNSINATAISYKNQCKVRFVLNGIQDIDNGAIGMLLTLVNALARRKVRSYGDMPNNVDARIAFEQSGFFQYVRMLQGKKVSATDSFIVQQGSDRTNSQAIGSQIRKIMLHLTGKEQRHQPLYSLIGEIISNSIEHANALSKDKNWLLSVHYESDRVRVMVTDIGKGILTTLRKKTSQKLRDTITLTSGPEVLFNLFNRKYQSSTFEKNRNKGLPKIKECYDNNFIQNLLVITNNVYLDFNGIDTRVLTPNFQGTFYSWDLTSDNISKWQLRTK